MVVANTLSTVTHQPLVQDTTISDGAPPDVGPQDVFAGSTTVAVPVTPEPAPNNFGPLLTLADVAERLQHKESLTGANLAQLDLTTLDLHGVDLSHANLTGACLYGLDLTTTNLSHAILDEADLSEAIFSRVLNDPGSWAAAHPIVGYIQSASLTEKGGGDNYWTECQVRCEPIHVGENGEYFKSDGTSLGFDSPSDMKPFTEETGKLHGDRFTFDGLEPKTMIDGFEIRVLHQERGERELCAINTNQRLGRDDDYTRYHIDFDRRFSTGSPILMGFDPNNFDAQFPDASRYIRHNIDLTAASMVHTKAHNMKLDGLQLADVTAEGQIVEVPRQSMSIEEIATQLVNGERDFSYADFSGIDFRETGIDFSECTLTGCNFNGANLSATDMDSADLRYVDFTNAVLSEVTHLPGAEETDDYERWQVTHPIVGYVERERTRQCGDNDDEHYLERMPVRIDTDGYYHFDVRSDHKNAAKEKGSGLHYKKPLSRTPPEGFVPITERDGQVDGNTFRFFPQESTLEELGGTVFMMQQHGDNEDLESYKSKEALLRGIKSQHQYSFFNRDGTCSGKAFIREMIRPGGHDEDPTYEYIPLKYHADADGNVTFTHATPPPLPNLGQSPFVTDFDPSQPLTEQLPETCYLQSESVSLTGTSLLGCTMNGVVGSGLQLSNTFLEDTSLVGADLSHAELDGLVCQNVTFDRANLTGAKMRNSALLESSLVETCAHRIDTIDCTFIDCDMRRADLSHSSMTNAFVEGCNVEEANAHGLRAHGSNLYEGSNFERAHFDRGDSCQQIPGLPPPEKNGFFEKWMPVIIKTATIIAFSKVPVIGWALGPLCSSMFKNNGVKGDFLKDWAIGVVVNAATNGISKGNGGKLGGFEGVGNYASKMVGGYLNNADAVSTGITMGQEFAEIATTATQVVADNLVEHLLHGDLDLGSIGFDSLVDFSGNMAFSTAMSGMDELGMGRAEQYAVANSVRYVVEQEIRQLGGLEGYTVDSLANHIVNTICDGIGNLVGEQAAERADEQALDRAAITLGFGGREALIAFCDGMDGALDDAMKIASGELSTSQWNDAHLSSEEPWESLPEGMTSEHWEVLQYKGCTQSEVDRAMNLGIGPGGLVEWVGNGHTVLQLETAHRLLKYDGRYNGWDSNADGTIVMLGKTRDAVIEPDGTARFVVRPEHMYADIKTTSAEVMGHLSEDGFDAMWSMHDPETATILLDQIDQSMNEAAVAWIDFVKGLQTGAQMTMDDPNASAFDYTMAGSVLDVMSLATMFAETPELYLEMMDHCDNDGVGMLLVAGKTLADLGNALFPFANLANPEATPEKVEDAFIELAIELASMGVAKGFGDEILDFISNNPLLNKNLADLVPQGWRDCTADTAAYLKALVKDGDNVRGEMRKHLPWTKEHDTWVRQKARIAEEANHVYRIEPPAKPGEVVEIEIDGVRTRQNSVYWGGNIKQSDEYIPEVYWVDWEDGKGFWALADGNHRTVQRYVQGEKNIKAKVIFHPEKRAKAALFGDREFVAIPDSQVWVDGSHSLGWAADEGDFIGDASDFQGVLKPGQSWLGVDPLSVRKN